ncbi:MAG: histidine--tRNA ligase [Actinobacteria bacterium]|nr:histidine--tRNA ligase [Actinomycetota bacterium]
MSDQPSSFSAPRGTRDLLPPESWRWHRVFDVALNRVFGPAGYEPMDTPIFEHTEVFERGVGEATEVVSKQMYTFNDRGGRSLTLRPEATAGIVRAVLENRLDRGSLPVKLLCWGPMFRQERPQKGRYRQFTQIDIEAIGSEGPAIDAEIIELAARFLSEAGAECRLLLNSLGHLDGSCRLGYLKALVDYLRTHENELAPEDRSRIDDNPLRAFDSKEEPTIAVMKGAPAITDHLCNDCEQHFDEVRRLLDALDLEYTIDHTLVRGLDYYTRTAFEFVSDDVGAQASVLGGGRYDGLAESLGGGHLPGIGFALGVDRLLLASRTLSEWQPRHVGVFVVALGDRARSEALPIVTELRRAGVGADWDLMGRGMKGQMKSADRSGANWAVILGDDELDAGEVTLKDLATGEQQRIARGQLVIRVRAKES